MGIFGEQQKNFQRTAEELWENSMGTSGEQQERFEEQQENSVSTAGTFWVNGGRTSGEQLHIFWGTAGELLENSREIWG